MVRRASTASLRDSVRMIRPHAIHSSAGVAPARSMGINARAPVRVGREPYVAESPDLPTRRDRGETTRGIVYFHEPVCSVKGFYLFLSALLFCHGRHTLGKSRRARSWLNGSACSDACISAPEIVPPYWTPHNLDVARRNTSSPQRRHFSHECRTGGGFASYLPPGIRWCALCLARYGFREVYHAQPS